MTNAGEEPGNEAGEEPGNEAGKEHRNEVGKEHRNEAGKERGNEATVSLQTLKHSCMLHAGLGFSTLYPLLSLVPSGAKEGPGKVSQSTSWQRSLFQSTLHTLTLRSPLATSQR